MKVQLKKNYFFIKENIHKYPLFEKLLGFSLTLNNLIVPIMEKKANEIKNPKNLNVTDKEITEQSIVGLCVLNMQTLFSTLSILEGGSITDCSNLIRTVVESIPKMFYMIHNPKDTFHIILHEEFQLWKSQEKYRNYTNHESFEYFKKYLNEDEKGMEFQKRLKIDITKSFYQDFSRKFNATWYRKKIYTEKILKIQNTFYSSLSNLSHPSIMRINMSTEYDSELSKQYMKILTDLAFYNLYILFNTSYTIIDEIGESEDTKNFIIDSQEELKTYFEVTHLRPDIPLYLSNLIL